MTNIKDHSNSKLYEWTNIRPNDRPTKRTNERTNKWMNPWIDGWMKGRIEICNLLNQCTNTYIDTEKFFIKTLLRLKLLNYFRKVLIVYIWKLDFMARKRKYCAYTNFSHWKLIDFINVRTNVGWEFSAFGFIFSLRNVWIAHLDNVMAVLNKIHRYWKWVN